jgi:hypothetical protein
VRYGDAVRKGLLGRVGEGCYHAVFGNGWGKRPDAKCHAHTRQLASIRTGSVPGTSASPMAREEAHTSSISIVLAHPLSGFF